MLTLNQMSQTSDRLAFFNKGLMNYRISIALSAFMLVFWSCDDPLSFESSNFVYNPFSFKQDTLYTVKTIQAGEADVQWGSHLRSWVGETQYYKSGITVDFTFADTSLDIALVDSIQFQLRHIQTFNENGADTLLTDYLSFGFYEITDHQLVDIDAETYGALLGSDTMNVKGGNNYWAYTLQRVGDVDVEDVIILGDTTISLGIFPNELGVMSMLYGGGSSIRPILSFYSHEPDTAEADSVTSKSFLADSLYMHIMEQADAFGGGYGYISQLSNDSLIFSIELDDIVPGGDTLLHIISSSFLPAIDSLSSSLYLNSTSDSLQRFYMTVTDPVSEYGVEIQLGENNTYNTNQINLIIQSALDDDRTEIDLILRPGHVGYDPGFIAVSMDPLQSAIHLNTSMAVRP